MAFKFYGTKAHSEDTIVLPNDSGKGLQVGRFAEDSDWGWRDITSPIEVRGVAATDPAWAQVGSTDFYAYQFGVGDYVWQTAHIPHDIVPGTPVHFHVHWFPGTVSSPMDTNAVTWEFEYAYAKGFDQQAFDFAHATSPLTNSGTVYATSASPGTLYQHVVTETAAVIIPDLTEPDGLIHYRVGRINNQTSPVANNAEEIFVLTTDIHYQSTNMATKQKAPNFYAD